MKKPTDGDTAGQDGLLTDPIREDTVGLALDELLSMCRANRARLADLIEQSRQASRQAQATVVETGDRRTPARHRRS